MLVVIFIVMVFIHILSVALARQIDHITLADIFQVTFPAASG
jgi:hypothetical protein